MWRNGGWEEGRDGDHVGVEDIYGHFSLPGRDKPLTAPKPEILECNLRPLVEAMPNAGNVAVLARSAEK